MRVFIESFLKQNIKPVTIPKIDETLKIFGQLKIKFGQFGLLSPRNVFPYKKIPPSDLDS